MQKFCMGLLCKQSVMIILCGIYYRHRWLHYMTDDPPTVKKPVDYKWLSEHTPNYSGTSKAYTPYSTTKPKIQAWVPPK